MCLLGMCGLAINLFLLASRISGDGDIAGCGGGGCDEVLGSRWSAVFGVPVTAFGAFAYLVFLITLVPGFDRWRIPLLGIISGAAVWFILLQALWLKQFCPWCMAAHGIAFSLLFLGCRRHGDAPASVSGWTRPVAWLATGFAAILLAQVFGPQAASHRVEDAEGRGRMVSFGGGREAYDVARLPRLGKADARHVLVEYFDYQCAACRTMAGFLRAFMDRHPDELAVILLPVPLDGTCNPFLGNIREHPGSCTITRMALAVWHSKPGDFAEFHQSLLDPDTADVTPARSRELALRYMDAAELDQAINATWIDELVYSNITDWRALSGGTSKLPKLLIREGRILHGLPSGEADFIRVMEKELGL